MSGSQSLSPSSESGPGRLRRRFSFRRAGLLVMASALAGLLIAASSTAAASTGPVESPIAAAPASVASAPLPVSSPTPSALATASPVAPSTPPVDIAAAEGVVGRLPVQSRTAEPPQAVAFGGRNRFSIPTLGINSSIGTSSCGGLIPNGIWYWPCAGHNNLYLMGHAWGVFAPLRSGYHSGLLTTGLPAFYADHSGVVHRYRLLWVQDLPVAVWGQGASWAATAGPVITLQTCDGSSDQYRIIVRFVPA